MSSGNMDGSNGMYDISGVDPNNPNTVAAANAMLGHTNNVARAMDRSKLEQLPAMVHRGGFKENIDIEESRRNREETTNQIRKNKKEERVAKQRQFPTGGLSGPADMSSGNMDVSNGMYDMSGGAGVSGVDPNNPNMVAAANAMLGHTNNVARAMDRSKLEQLPAMVHRGFKENIDIEESRRNREEITNQIRKNKKEERVAKQRQFPTGGLSGPADMSSGNMDVSNGMYDMSGGAGVSGVDPNNPNMVAAANAMLGYANNVTRTMDRSKLEQLPAMAHRGGFKENIDVDESRRNREETTNQIRKNMKDERVAKQRQFPTGGLSGPADMSSGNMDVSNGMYDMSGGAGVSGVDPNNPNMVAATNAMLGPTNNVARALDRSKLEQLPAMVHGVMGNDPAVQIECTTQIRCLLSIEKNPPIQQVIDTGVVPRFVEFLTRDDNPALQFEAAWALTLIASGTSEHAKVVMEMGAIPTFIRLLSSPNDDVRELAVLALGNIAGASPPCRDFVLQANAMHPLLQQLHGHSKLSMLRNATWTLFSFCRGKSQSHFDLVRSALPTLAQLVFSPDEEVLTYACWALSFLSDGHNEKIQAVVESGVCRRLVELLLNPSAAVQTPALRTVRNIVTGNDLQTQFVINSNALPYLLALLSSPKKGIRKEACWTISNITAGNRAQIQAVIDNNIIPPLIQLLTSAEFDIRKAAAWAIRNAILGGNAAHFKFLVQQGCIRPLCDLLTVSDAKSDAKIVTIALKGLENILKMGEEESAITGTNGMAVYVSEAEGFSKIKILKTYFQIVTIALAGSENILKMGEEESSITGTNGMAVYVSEAEGFSKFKILKTYYQIVTIALAGLENILIMGEEESAITGTNGMAVYVSEAEGFLKIKILKTYFQIVTIALAGLENILIMEEEESVKTGTNEMAVYDSEAKGFLKFKILKTYFQIVTIALAGLENILIMEEEESVKTGTNEMAVYVSEAEGFSKFKILKTSFGVEEEDEMAALEHAHTSPKSRCRWSFIVVAIATNLQWFRFILYHYLMHGYVRVSQMYRTIVMWSMMMMTIMKTMMMVQQQVHVQQPRRRNEARFFHVRCE
jgi:importin subunit alpha-6/7